MKGNIRFTIEIKDETGNFPVTETFTIEQDNTYEDIYEWIEAFKKILYCAGFGEGIIEEVFGEKA